MCLCVVTGVQKQIYVSLKTLLDRNCLYLQSFKENQRYFWRKLVIFGLDYNEKKGKDTRGPSHSLSFFSTIVRKLTDTE